MKYRTLALGVFCVAILSGQHRMSWQNLCFNNPALPVCPGHDYAIKPDKKAAKNRKDGSTAPGAAPLSAADSDIDWRFADPGADALVGFNLTALRDSPVARNLILQLGAKQGLNEAGLQKIFDTLSGVDQIIISVYNNRAVAMLTGRVSEAMFPAPEPGLRAALVSDGVLLFGRSDQVDEARRRMTTSIPLSEITQFADDRHSDSHFWAIAQPKLAGAQAVSAGVRRVNMTVLLGDQVTSDIGLQFFGSPTPDKLRTWQPTLGDAVVEGNNVHVRRSLEPAEAKEKLTDFLTSPIGDQLALLISAGRYLPPSDGPKRARPVVVGLN
jgi:hypothetical protein